LAFAVLYFLRFAFRFLYLRAEPLTMLKSLIRLLAYPVLFGALYSCNSNKTKQASTGKEPANALEAVAVGLPPRVDSVFVSYPADSTVFPVSILNVGEYHAEEVDAADALRNWYGIFLNKEGYYLDSTRIIATRVEDMLGDENGQKTGWLVKTSNSDSCVQLISGVEGLQKRKIAPITIAKPEMLPGTSTTFTCNGIKYTLSATANIGPNEDNYAATSYRLVLKATINGVEKQQLLVAHPAFGDAMTTIVFAGDIDGDGFPDFIIDTINHYNGFRPTLYLSKPAGGKQLLKVMGWHLSVGC
jgi:hypothetical protein